VAEKISNVGKVMLTVFTSNEAAVGFYRSQSFITDEVSPRDKKLRGGKVVSEGYLILSKEVKS
jgi:N-alpha-acetyltransferase 40